MHADVEPRKMPQAYLALLGFVFVQMLAVVLPASSAPGHGDHIPQPAMSCDPRNSTCPDHFCCVKKVITYADVSKYAIGFTECQPLRKLKYFCLVITEDFMCPCEKGLMCKVKDGDNFGHCEPAVD
ncbi:uncharacterized protein [Haliotis cracherodii]|uniref:uncharacterized protein n=1 Tax=Haliotis cracherodii TaxID=6455 RepID=UPI0039EB20C3